MRRFAETLEDIAGQAKLYDVTDVAVRVATRRRGARTLAVSALAMLVLTCALGVGALLNLGGGSIGRPEGGPGRLNGEPSALVRPLLDAPTRGSLAGDTAYLKALLDRVVDDPEAYGLPGDRALLRVLFAGDLPGNRRLALVAGATGAPRLITLTGRKGVSAKDLELTGWGDVETPVVREEWRGGRGDSGYIVLFGPTGYDVSVSNAPRYLVDGSIQREWTPEPAGYLALDTGKLPPGLRVRMSRDAAVFYEGRVASPGTARVGDVDVNPLHGRGKPAPVAARSAADALAYSSGLTGPGIRYVVLWSDDYFVEDPNGGGTGMGQIATVMALTSDGGGPYITVATDVSPQPNARTHPTAEGVLGDPDRALIAMRMPHFTMQPPDTLQLVAPPAAVRVDIVRGDGEIVATVPLVNGVGKLDLAGPLQVTVRAFDAQGTVVAERAFTDSLTSSGVEPELQGW